ncbi:MAG: ATP-binding protein [Bacteroidia bacterium]
MKTYTDPIKSEHTKLKVAIGYLLSLSIVFLLAYVAYKSFQKILISVETLSSNKNESTLVKRIASGITDIQMSSKIYSITLKSSDFDSYIGKTNKVTILVDSLKFNLSNQQAYKQADSLDVVFKEYTTSLHRWFTIKAAGSNNDFKKIAELIKQEEDSLVHSVINIPSARTTTVINILEKPVPVNSTPKTEPKKSIFQRIFGSKKKSDTLSIPPSTSVKQQITTKTSTQVDTNYYQQVDTLITKVKEALISTEKTKKVYKKQLAKVEMNLLNYQSLLIAEIDKLLKNIERRDLLMISSKVTLSKQTAENASETLLYIEISALIISIIFMYIIFVDITKSSYYKIMLEHARIEAEKLAKAKEEFLANMSHEIRTPLTSIIGFSEQLECAKLQDVQKQQLNSIIGSSEHLLAIVNDILDYSKIEAGSLKIEKIGFCIGDVIFEVVEAMRPAAQKKGIQLFYEKGAGSESCISGDPFRLKQVLINLVGNSIKFTEIGYVCIETFFIQKNNKYFVRFEVKDTGIGIDKDKLKEIFADFSQADNSITRKHGGTGLGLSISKKIVEMQNGCIWVNSILNKGSVFSFEIPYVKADKNEYILKYCPNYKYSDALKDKKLLVIDDDDMIPLLLTPILQSWHICYTFCNKSTKAWDLLQENVYHFVMLDIQMPDLDGFELLTRIKTQTKSKNKKTNIIVCTANVLIDVNKLHQYTVDCHLLYKPFKKPELWNILCKSTGIQAIVQHTSTFNNNNGNLNRYSLKNFKTYANEDSKILELFIDTFILQSKAELNLMKNNFLQINYKQVGEIAHKLKNTYGQFEDKEANAILQKLEELTLGNNITPKEIEEQINALFEVSSLLFSYLKEEIYAINGSQKSKL